MPAHSRNTMEVSTQPSPEGAGMTEIEELRLEVEKMRARSTADMAFLHSTLLTLSTPQLRGGAQTMAKVAEDITVKLLYRVDPDAVTAAYEERKTYWLNALQAEIAARPD